MSLKRPVTHKHCHTSRGKALAHLRNLRQRFDYEGRAYPCPYCSCWHVGRANKTEHKNKYAPALKFLPAKTITLIAGGYRAANR